MNPGVRALAELVDRHEEQKAAGEWEGPGVPHWLSMRRPCGSSAPCMCAGLHGRRAVVWSQVMAAPDLPFGRMASR